ncbi:MAG: DnaJ domain-containing protein [Synechococcaceae cyanobacterium SM2_3_60]|nr:DnaJ domain-containing protein [Synechococcaceae cyanobacterium SM2_3_60]
MNHYQILGVEPTATVDVIKQAYRQLARQFHPDVAGSAAQERFVQISLAYQVLSDPQQRRDYDRTLPRRYEPPTPKAAPPPRPTVKVRTPAPKPEPKRSEFIHQPVQRLDYEGTIREIYKAFSQHQFAIATKHAEQLVEHYPKDLQALHLMALAYYRRGSELLYYQQHKLAEVYLSEALKTEPNNHQLRSAIRQALHEATGA